MPNDSKGVKKIYPDSTTNPQSLYYNGSLTNQIQMSQSLGGPNHKSGGILSFNQGNDDAFLNFITSSGYNSSKVRPTDHSRWQTQKFMQDSKDWKNVECTAYVRINDGGTSAGGGGGSNNFSYPNDWSVTTGASGTKVVDLHGNVIASGFSTHQAGIDYMNAHREAYDNGLYTSPTPAGGTLQTANTTSPDAVYHAPSNITVNSSGGGGSGFSKNDVTSSPGNGFGISSGADPNTASGPIRVSPDNKVHTWEDGDTVYSLSQWNALNDSGRDFEATSDDIGIKYLPAGTFLEEDYSISLDPDADFGQQYSYYVNNTKWRQGPNAGEESQEYASSSGGGGSGGSRTSNAFIIWRVRTGFDRKQSGDCETCGYEGQILPNGQVRGIKRYYTGKTFFKNFVSATDDLEDRWVGFKFIVYNKGSSAICEIWLDENNNNNWVKATTVTDNENWGNGGDHCSANDDSEVISWGGPIASLTWIMDDNPQSIEFQKLSVREINGDSGALPDSGEDDDGTGGSGSGGSGGGSSGGGTGGNSNLSADKFGVIPRYATGQITYDWNENFRSDGKRFDFDVGGDEYVSCELRGYFKSSSNIGDDVSGKLGGGGHHDGSHPKCYVPDLSTDDGGNVRLRYEENHPSTPTLQDGAGSGTDDGKGITGAFVGFCYVKRNLDNGNVLLQVWQDQGDNEGDEPANEWKLIGSWEDDELQWTQPPSDHAETLRIDNDSGHNLQWKWIALQEIQDSDSSEPGSGNGGGGEDTDGDGDVDEDDDNDDGGGDGDGGHGDGTGGTGSGPSTPPAPPAPPREVYQTAYLELMWNINYVSGDPCNVNAPPEDIPPQEVFNNAGDDSYVNLPRDLMTGGWFINKGSVLIGRRLRQVNVIMKKQNAPTGPITLRIYDKTNTVVDEFDDPVDAAVLDGNDTTYEFYRESPSRTLQERDRISLDFFGTGTVGDTINYIRVKISESDKVDSTATCLFVTDDNKNIEVNENLDLAGSVYI